MGATVVLLIQKPEWYVIDTVAIFMGAGMVASMGMSFSVFLSIILLIGMIIYDALAVYKSKHMIKLAESVIKMRIPVIMIVPVSLPYTWLVDKSLSNPSRHEAYFMGLGDLVFPGMLVVSVYANVQNPLITLSVVLGTLVGFVMVSYFVSKGKAQAGLPFLCTGAILGFVFSSLLIYGRLML
jgi:presenilin-like A22 family membrane protease